MSHSTPVLLLPRIYTFPTDYSVLVNKGIIWKLLILKRKRQTDPKKVNL